jgi:hypothetical protein
MDIMFRIKKLGIVLGVIIWVGVLSPEIFVKSGTGCIFDENGKALTKDEAEEFMEAYFYKEAPVEVKYKFSFSDIK